MFSLLSFFSRKDGDQFVFRHLFCLCQGGLPVTNGIPASALWGCVCVFLSFLLCFHYTVCVTFLSMLLFCPDISWYNDLAWCPFFVNKGDKGFNLIHLVALKVLDPCFVVQVLSSCSFNETIVIVQRVKDYSCKFPHAHCVFCQILWIFLSNGRKLVMAR